MISNHYDLDSARSPVKNLAQRLTRTDPHQRSCPPSHPPYLVFLEAYYQLDAGKQKTL